MLYSTVDARDNVYSNSCDKCCCETLAMRPGETNLMVLNYAPWALPLLGKGLGCTPQFDLQQIQACPIPSGSNTPPVANGPLSYTTPLNTLVNISLGTSITDPDGDPLEFSLVPLYGPYHGTLSNLGILDGAGTYTPNNGFTGYDRFFVSVSDGVNKPVMFEVVIGVGVTEVPATAFTPSVKIPPDRISVDQRMYTLSFPIEISPAAKPCEVWRLTVRQNAYDCNFNCYWHVSCYDITIKQC